MSLEKTEIMSDLLDRLRLHPDEPLVTEDLNKAGDLTRLPLIFVVEGQDDVTHTGMSHGETIYTRQGLISIISIIQADTGELMAPTMRNFQANLRKQVYKDERRRIGSNAGIRELRVSRRIPVQAENNTCAQETVFRVDYKENISQLFDEIIPTT